MQMRKGSTQIIVPKLNSEWNKTKCVLKTAIILLMGCHFDKKKKRTQERKTIWSLWKLCLEWKQAFGPQIPKVFLASEFLPFFIHNPKIIQHILDYLKMFPSYGGMHNTRCFPSHSFNTLHWELFPCSNMAIAEDWWDFDFLLLHTNLKTESRNWKYLEYLGSIPSLYCRDKRETSLLWTSLS